MAVPSDRAGLLRYVVELERALELLDRGPGSDDPEHAFAHARLTVQLANGRAELGERRAGEALFREAAMGFMRLGSVEGKRQAAFARINQADVAFRDNRWRDALSAYEEMIDEQGGVPTLEGFARAMYGWLALWLRMLQQAEDQSRLYEASAIALSILDPDQSRAERQWVAEALARHAGSADHLGLVQEALEYYQRAIPLLEEFDSEKPVHMLLDHAVSRVLTLHLRLRNEEEAKAAAYRVIDRFKGTKNPVWRLSVANARVVLGLRGFGRSGRRDPPS